MERTHKTSTVVSTNLSNRTDDARSDLGFRTAMLACCFVLVSTIGCGKPLAYHFQHYHRPFAAIAKSNQTYFHSPQTGKIIPKDPCASYCEPGCYGFEPTTWTHWPVQCPGKFPVQGEVYEEPVDTYGDAGYYEGVVGEPVVMDSMHSIPAPAPAISDAMDISAQPPVAPGTSRVGSGVPSSVVAPPKVAPPVAIPTDIESAIPSPSDATNSGMPFTRTKNVAQVRSVPTKPKPPTSTTPILSPPSITPPSMSPPVSTPPPPVTLPPTTKPKLNLKSVFSDDQEVDRTVEAAAVEAATVEPPARKLVSDSSAQSVKPLAARLRRTPPVEDNKHKRTDSADSLKKIRMASGNSTVAVSKPKITNGPSLSEKLFTVRELDEAPKVQKIQVEEIQVNKLAEKIKVDKSTMGKKPLQLNTPKTAIATNRLPLAKKVTPTVAPPFTKQRTSDRTTSKVTPSGLRLAKKVRPKTSSKVTPKKVVATKVTVPGVSVTKAATSKPNLAVTPKSPNKPAASTLKIPTPAKKAKPIAIAAKKPTSTKLVPTKPKPEAKLKIVASPVKSSAPVVTKKTVPKKTVSKSVGPRLTPVQLDFASAPKINVNEMTQAIVPPKSAGLTKPIPAKVAKTKKTAVVMKANAEKANSMIQFAKDPPRRELRVTTLPDSGPSIRFK